MIRASQRALLAGCLGAGVCALAAPPLALPVKPQPVKEVYFDGRPVTFAAVTARAAHSFSFGPWQYGLRVSSVRPSDRRPNLYVVVPGMQHQSDGAGDFDHTAIVNTLPEHGPVDWDVYWAIVLDPEMTRDLQDETDLLREAQAEFVPAADLAIDDVPGRQVLQRYLHITSVNGLDRFRRKSGRLPRVVIVPAGFCLRATASEIDTAEP